MTRNIYIWIPVVIIALSILTSCKKDNPEDPIPESATVSTYFESGSIGEIVKNSGTNWELYLADDNNNHELPETWRNWWYVKMGNITTDSVIEITLKNRGWPFYYLPVYSYNQEDWIRFTEDEVSQNIENELIINKRFYNTTVWIARFYPYTLTDLEKYIDGVSGNQNIETQIAGYSQNGKPIYVFKLTDFNYPDSDKKRIFMHARTHPAETPPSFVLEGMIDFLLSGSSEALEILSGFEFYIFPMQNVDGVSVGNYRSTPLSQNLEVMWYYDTDNPLVLTNDAPTEVQLIHQYAENLMSDGGPQISIALNLHASNSEPDVRTFFYPHFGTEALGYTTEEASLWEKQISFISSFATHFGANMIEPIPSEGGNSFAAKTYPESWWWVNYKDQVMAMTMEMTYGRAGYEPRWIGTDDLRNEGKDLALGIRDYFDPFFIPAPMLSTRDNDTRILEYPELYPPADPDELKK